MSVVTTAARRGGRDSILDAADALVREQGVNRMTLDAVAARAGLSKGGLLYHFPSKDALLKGMIERFVARLSEPDDVPVAARVIDVRLARQAEDRDQRRAGHSMLAAIAEQPALLDPVRSAHREIWAEMKGREGPCSDGLIAWLAAEGLCFFDLFDTSPLSDEERDQVIARIKALATSG
jgi:AcrR family transcriptional regulator